MNKFYVFLFIVILGVFAGIFYITQEKSLFRDLGVSPSPILPPDSNSLRFIPLSPLQTNTTQKPEQTAQNIRPTFGVEEGLKASYSAVIQTSKGDIEIDLVSENAPATIKNFIDKANSGFYKGLTFHRVEDWVIQGGDPKGTGGGGGLMRTELNVRPFIEGSVGVARGGDINVSNDSQFFITKSEAAWLNEKYTNFGIVTSGMDVVNKIGIGDKILKITVE